MPPLNEQARSKIVSTSRARYRGMLAWVWIIFWLMFLVQPVIANIADGGRHTVGALLLILGGAIYAPGIVFPMRRLWAGEPRTQVSQGYAGLSALLVTACMLGAAPLIGSDAFALLPYGLVILAMGLHRRMAVPFVIGILGAVYSLSPALTGKSLESGLLIASIASALASGLGAFSAERTRDADAAREDAALLRLQDERNRMARDLHDILGHSLTVITMKAELAGKLIDVDPEKARTQIREVEELSRSALADVRTTVSGYREMSLAGELTRARRTLQDAGIRVDAPGHVDDVSPDLRDLFAWAVREATTNVIRHSGAKNVEIALTPTSLSIRDDGHGAPASVASGSGLAGLRDRATTYGAVLSTQSSPSGFTVTVEAKPLETA